MNPGIDKKEIWTIEDDPSCRFVYEEILGLRYHLLQHPSVPEFSEALRSSTKSPDLVIADLRLPDQSFLNFWSKTNDSSLPPFLIVSSVDDLDVLRHCFKMGAIDYLTKPFGHAELIIKVEHALTDKTRFFRSTDVSLNPASLTASRSGIESSPLTPKEFKILSLMFKAERAVMSRSALVSQVWGETRVSMKALDVHLFHLRRKLAPLDLDILHVPPQMFRILSKD